MKSECDIDRLLKSKYNGVYLYEDSDYADCSPGDATPYRIALQRGDAYSDGDLSVSIFYSRRLGRCVVNFAENPRYRAIYDPAPAGPGVRLSRNPILAPMRDSWLKNLSFGELLMILQYLYKCVALRDSPSRVRDMSSACGVKKDDWLPWFEFGVSAVGNFLQQWLLDRKDRLDRLAVKSTRCYRFNPVSGLYRRDGIGGELRFPEHSTKIAKQFRWWLQYDAEEACLMRFDTSGRPVEFHPIDHCLNDGFVWFESEFAGEAKPAGASAPAGEPAAPAWRPKSIGVTAEAKRIFGLSLLPVYDILERDCSGEKEYLKVINDSGQEVWVGRDRVISVL